MWCHSSFTVKRPVNIKDKASYNKLRQAMLVANFIVIGL